MTVYLYVFIKKSKNLKNKVSFKRITGNLSDPIDLGSYNNLHLTLALIHHTS